MVSTGKKILTKHEQTSFIVLKKEGELKDYPQYAEQLDELDEYCSAAANFRGIFDYISEPIYFDRGHTGPSGNQIIAKEVYLLSFPIVLAHEDVNPNEESYTKTPLEGMNSQLISNDLELFTKQFYNMLRDVVSLYQTPRVISLIFQTN